MLTFALSPPNEALPLPTSCKWSVNPKLRTVDALPARTKKQQTVLLVLCVFLWLQDDHSVWERPVKLRSHYYLFVCPILSEECLWMCSLFLGHVVNVASNNVWNVIISGPLTFWTAWYVDRDLTSIALLWATVAWEWEGEWTAAGAACGASPVEDLAGETVQAVVLQLLWSSRVAKPGPTWASASAKH